MQFFSRAVLRAATSTATSSVGAVRLSTRAPAFAARAVRPTALTPIARRWNSDAAKPVDEKIEEPAPEAAATPGRRDKYSPGVRRLNKPLDAKPSEVIYIGNLLFEITTEQLLEVFGKYGTIKDGGVTIDHRGLSKGYAFLTFETVEQATAAIEAMNQQPLEGRNLLVAYQTRGSRPVRETAATTTLFIGNIAFEASDRDLNQVFASIKNCLDIRVAVDRRTGQPRGFVHAEFIDVESAKAAKAQLEGKQLFGRTLRIDYSKSLRNQDRDANRE